MENKERIRLDYLDIVKFIAVICLFLAHVNTPKILMEIRGFDVIAMVVLSSILAKSSLKRSSSSKNFIKKRIKRLVIPTWIFLIFMYFCMFIIGKLPTFWDIFKSFFFQRDCGIVGYVWIIWIYILCAFMIPLINKIF